MMSEYATADHTTVTPTLVPLRSEGPAFGLLSQSEGADLLVVGSHGEAASWAYFSVQSAHNAYSMLRAPSSWSKLPTTD